MPAGAGARIAGSERSGIEVGGRASVVRRKSPVPREETGSGPERAGVLGDLVASQASWFAVVLGAAAGHPWWGAILGSIPIGVQVFRSGPDPAQLRFMVFAVSIGAALESLNAGCGVYVPTSGALHPFIAAPWLLVLWAGFSLTFRRGFAWASGRVALLAVLGAMAGPISFYGGERLGAVVLSRDPGLLLLLAIEWAVVMPVLSRRADVEFRTARSS